MRTKTEITDTPCPKCGAALHQTLEYTETLSGGDWEPTRRPHCPRGHRLEFTLSGEALAMD